MTKRVKTTPEMRSEARRYYHIGLKMSEISKLLDGVSIRTLEVWQASDKWKEQQTATPIEKRISELRTGGKSFTEIGVILNISKSKAYRLYEK